MSDENPTDDLLQRALARVSPEVRAAVASRLPSTNVDYDDDLIPQADAPDLPDRTLVDTLKGIPILDVYVKYGGDMSVSKRTSKTELDLRCPVPSHPDRNPSTSFNTEKNLWHCHVCSSSGEGDGIDLAAAHYGYPIPSYRKTNFSEVLDRMAADFGIQTYSMGGEVYGRVENEGGGESIPPPVEDAPPKQSLSSGEVQDSGPEIAVSPEMDDPEPEIAGDEQPKTPALTLAPPVVELYDNETVAEAEDTRREALIERNKIDWSPLVEDGTFLAEWMDSVAVPSDLPHEFFFWQGLQALGFATGRDLLFDLTPPVPLRFFLVLCGATAMGKSRSIKPFKELIDEAFPFKYDPYADPTGVLPVHEPGSGEALIEEFVYEVLDSSTNKVDHLAPVTGYLEFPEFAGMMSRVSRSGSTLKTRLMEFYDTVDGVVRGASVTGGRKAAQAPFLQVTTTTQPDAVSMFLERGDLVSGFLNRWTYIFGPKTREVSLVDLGTHDLGDSVEALKEVRRWVTSLPSTRYTMDAAASARFRDRDASIIRPLKMESNMLGRLDLTVLKVAMGFAVNENAKQIRESHVEKAFSLVDYISNSSALFTEDVVSDAWTKAETRVMAYVEKNSHRRGGRGVKRKEIANGCKGHQIRSTEIRGALDMLVALGHIEEVPPLKGENAPTMRVALGAGPAVTPT